MNSVVIYVSHTGNTRRIAEAVAAELELHGPVDLLEADGVAGLPVATDLLLIGGPTEQHGVTSEIVALFERLPASALRGVSAAAFDTRLKWPEWLSGSAAARIGERLEQAGAMLVVAPESFIVSMKPELAPGEEQRASAWAASVAHHAETRMRSEPTERVPVA
jgi:flavodoxin